MKNRQDKKASVPERSIAHVDHLDAQEDHARWMKELQHWRHEYEAAVLKFVRRQLPELELDNFEQALDRHEAAILAHQELVTRHEQRIRVEKSGLVEASEEVDSLHQQMHDRHELSRRQHDELARSCRAIVRALAMFESAPRK